MKRLLSFIAAVMLLSAPVGLAQNFNVWVTTEGSGMQISSGGRYMPPPPPRHSRHYQKTHKHYKNLKKKYKAHKKYMKARKKYEKARREFYHEMRH